LVLLGSNLVERFKFGLNRTFDRISTWIFIFQEASSDDLFQLTDSCSLSYLKSLNELLVKQRSELLSRLFLILASITADSENEGIRSKLFFESWFDLQKSQKFRQK